MSLVALAIALAAPTAVADTPPLALTLPTTITAEATSGSGAAVDFTVTSNRASATVSCDHQSGSVFSIGTTTVVCTATDGPGDSASGSFPVVVQDTTPPAVTVPGNISQAATTSAGSVVGFTASAVDAVDGPLSPSCSPAAGSTFPLGETTVTCSATDAHANTGRASFSVTVTPTVTDTTPPVVTVPGDVTKEATSRSGAGVTFAASAMDNVDGALPVLCSPASGATFSIGSATVQCRATDAHGNTGSASFNVQVVDTTAPTLNLPADMSLTTQSPGGASATFTVTASDTVDGAIVASCSPASGITFPVGTTAVGCRATDAHRNTSTGSFAVIVTLVDTTPPVVRVPGDLTAEAQSSSGSTVTFTVSAADNLDGPVAPSCSRASGTTFPLGTTTVVCSATDRSNNKGSSSFKVTVVDTTKPVVHVPADVSADAVSPNGAVASFTATGEDLVDGQLAVSCTPASGALFPVGTTTVTCTATDAHRNTGTAAFTTTIRPAKEPVVTPPAAAAAPAQPAAPDTKPPAKVGNLVARASDGAVSLTWQPPSDPDFDHVVVEQSTAGTTRTVVYTGSATGYKATGLKNAVEQRFVVVSYDTSGNASDEAVVTATPAAVMLILPKEGAVQKTPPLLDWRDVAGASYYNVQLYRIPSLLEGASGAPAGLKVLSAWPTASRLRLTTIWSFGKKRYRLAPGIYRWYVWPGFGPRADVRYGALLGQSTFAVRR